MRLDKSGCPEFKPCFFTPYKAEFLPNLDNRGDEAEEFPEYGSKVPFPELSRLIDGPEDVNGYISRYARRCRRSLKETHPPVVWSYREYVFSYISSSSQKLSYVTFIPSIYLDNSVLTCIRSYGEYKFKPLEEFYLSPAYSPPNNPSWHATTVEHVQDQGTRT